MSLNIDRSDALPWVVAHEFGHIIGLGDRYHEGIVSKIMGQVFGNDRTTTVEPGYESRMMGATSGSVDTQTLTDLTEENAPSSSESDDRIRDWVSAHISALEGLSTDSKINMIKTLLSLDSTLGWVSDEDITAVRRICRSVTDSTEAVAIRNSIEDDLTSLSSIGQRTQVRVILSQMP